MIHLAARTTFESYGVLHPSIVEGSKNLMDAALAAGVTTFVYAASLLVYGQQTGYVNENTPPAPQIDIARAKLEAELLLKAMAEHGGMSFCSLRLPHVYGVNSLLFKEIRRGRILFPGKGGNWFSHLHVFDAARALTVAARGARCGLYPVADDAPCAWNDLFSVIRDHLPGTRIIHVPREVALAATSLLALASRCLDKTNIYSPDGVRSWNVDCAVRPQTLKDFFSIEPRYPTVVQGIPAVLNGCVSSIRLVERSSLRG